MYEMDFEAGYKVIQFLLSFLVVIAPIVLVRYVVRRKPLSRKKSNRYSFIYVVLLYLISMKWHFMIKTLHPDYISMIIVFFVSTWILNSGYKKEKKKRKKERKLKEQKEHDGIEE